jgi:hypothetical protein
VSFQSDFYDYVLADAEIIAATGNDTEGVGKVYHLQSPEAEDPPYLVFQKITGQNHHHYGAASAIASAFYQFDCIGLTTTTDATDIAEAVRNRLDGYQGTMGSTVVRSMFVNTHREESEDPGDGSEAWISRVILEIEAWYVQTVPTG